MKRLVLGLALLGLMAATGCDYTVPLAAPQLPIDEQLIGLWQRTQDSGETQRLLVLPLGRQEYLVSLQGSEGLYARAWLCAGAGQTLAQVQWVGTGQGALPTDSRVYQLAAYTVTPEELQVRLVDAAVAGKAAASSAELGQALDAAKGRADLLKAPMVFRKAKK